MNGNQIFMGRFFPVEDLQIIQNSTHFCIETSGFGDAPIVGNLHVRLRY